MLDRIRNLFGGGGGGADPAAPSRLPPELVAAICAASVTFRPSKDADGGDRVLVVVPACGNWQFDGIAETAERIAAAWPELSPSQARHAATLLAGQIGQAARMRFSGRPARRSWVMDFAPPGLEDFR